MLHAAARIILRKWKFNHITTDVRDRLHWLPVQQRIEHKVCVLVYKCLHQHISLYCAHRCLNQPIVISEVSCGTAAVDCFGTGGRSKAGCDPEARLRHSSSWLTVERTATVSTTHPTLHEIRTMTTDYTFLLYNVHAV